MLYGNNADTAIEHETQALSILHDYPDSYREAVLCFKIYNSLGAFFTEKKDYPRAKLCLEQARTYADNFDMPLDDVAVMFHNLSAVDLLSGLDTAVFTFSGGGDNDKCIEILTKMLPKLNHTAALADRNYKTACQNADKLYAFAEDIKNGERQKN